MSKIEIFNIKSNWIDAKHYKEFLEKTFSETECELRNELTVGEIGSTFLAMKICKHKKHPYAYTQFPKKCTIENCPLLTNGMWTPQ